MKNNLKEPLLSPGSAYGDEEEEEEEEEEEL
jgi:hypothetical protein